MKIKINFVKLKNLKVIDSLMKFPCKNLRLYSFEFVSKILIKG